MIDKIKFDYIIKLNKTLKHYKHSFEINKVEENSVDFELTWLNVNNNTNY